jgi:hypothetical protein
VATIGNLFVRLRADTAEFDRGMKQASKVTDALDRQIRNLALGLGAYFGIRGLSSFARGAVSAWAEQEEAMISLQATLKATGRDGAGAFDMIAAAASRMQEQTVHGDEAILKATASLGQLATALDAGELAAAQRAIIGIADTFLNGDVNNAALLLGKTLGSTTNALTRYGIQIDTNASQHEKLQQVMRQSNVFFEVSQQRATSLTGQLQGLANAWGDTKEAIGKFLLERTGFGTFISGVKQMLQDLNVVLSGSSAQIQQAFELLGVAAGNAFSVAFLGAINKLISGPLSFIASTFGLAGALGDIKIDVFGGLIEEAKGNIVGAVQELHRLAQGIRAGMPQGAPGGGGGGLGLPQIGFVLPQFISNIHGASKALKGFEEGARISAASIVQAAGSAVMGIINLARSGGGIGGWISGLLGFAGGIASVIPGGQLVGAGLMAAGGITGALFGGRGGEPVAVRIDDYSERALAKQRRQGPDQVIVNLYGADGTLIQRQIQDRTRRDAVERLPSGILIGGT